MVTEKAQNLGISSKMVVLTWVFGLCWALFFTYCYLVRKNAKKDAPQKIKAVPIEDDKFNF